MYNFAFESDLAMYLKLGQCVFHPKQWRNTTFKKAVDVETPVHFHRA